MGWGISISKEARSWVKILTVKPGGGRVLSSGKAVGASSPVHTKTKPSFSTALSALLSSRNEACDLQWRQTSPTCVFIVPCCKIT